MDAAKLIRQKERERKKKRTSKQFNAQLMFIQEGGKAQPNVLDDRSRPLILVAV